MFYVDYNIKLELGGDEFIYLLVDEWVSYYWIIFVCGFYVFVLYEIVYWCVVGL